MTEKLPRRLSKRVVVSGGSLPAGVTRVVSSSGVSSSGVAAPATLAVDGSASGEQAVEMQGAERSEAGRAVADNRPEARAESMGARVEDMAIASRATSMVSGSAVASPLRPVDRRRISPPNVQSNGVLPQRFEPPSERVSRDPARRTPANLEPPSSEVVSTERLRVDVAGDRQPATPEASRGPRALVVDDDPEIRRALARLLRPELEVFLVGSVAQAKAALACLDRVDVAFVDWELPDGTGEEILEQLVQWPDAIRVLISARVVSSENPLKNRALANLVLGKPLALSVVEALKRAALALPHD